MRNSGYLAKRSARDDRIAHFYANEGGKIMFYCAAITLNDVFGFWPKRVQRFMEACAKYSHDHVEDCKDEFDLAKARLKQRIEQVTGQEWTWDEIFGGGEEAHGK